MFYPHRTSPSASSYLQEWLRRGNGCHTSWWYCPWSSEGSVVAPAAWCCAQSRGLRALLPASPQPSCSPSIGQTPYRTSEYTAWFTKYPVSTGIGLAHQWEWIKSSGRIKEPAILSPVYIFKKKSDYMYYFCTLCALSFLTILYVCIIKLSNKTQKVCFIQRMLDCH